MLFRSGLNSVRPDLIEAARLEGARGWAMLWHVVLPQLRPATFIAVVVTLGRMYRDSEMAIWFASGVGLMRFIRPVLRTGAVFASTNVMEICFGNFPTI